MPITLPTTAKALGRKVVVVLDTPPAAGTGIPITTEVNAALFAGLHLYTPFKVTPTENSGEGPRKLGAESSPTSRGLKNYPAVEISYSYMPQDAATPGADGNELFDILTEGAVVTVVVLNDLDGDISAVATGDVAHVYLMECGAQREDETGEGEFDEFAIRQNLYVKGGEPLALHHALAAA